MIICRVSCPIVCLASVLPLLPAGDEVVVPAPPDASTIATAPSFGPDEPVVATHYFYWYRWPDEHFFDDAGHTDDLLRHHFPDHRTVSYESRAWHRRQMQDMLAAGIDVALCVYWGAPNQYDKPDLRFSVRGLPPLVAALDEMARSGPTPRIGLFYDTSTLLARHAFRGPRRDNVDLRTHEGKDIFYRTIRDFFCLVPPRHWACLNGRPLVQLYNASFAAGHDQSTIDYVYERFAADFAGRRPFVIAGPSWSFGADARTGWGAALGGPLIGHGVVQIGPGYDDSPVPGRSTPTRDRLGGGFYGASWLLALQERPRLVIVETWSELHEGTGICETLEDGRYYVELTRRYRDMLKAGGLPSGEDWADTVRTLVEAEASNRAGREFANRLTLSLHVAADEKLLGAGLRLCRGVPDGACEITQIEGTPCIRTRPGVGRHRHLYFDVADPYYYDHRGTLTLRFTYFDVGDAAITVQYDAAEETGSLAERYKPHSHEVMRANTNTWKTATLKLPGARCANRQNGGADFRLLSVGAELAVSGVEVTKLPDGYGH
ncbi:MAG: DUF5010 domain-containing protein [Phycisphaerae bacterium]